MIRALTADETTSAEFAHLLWLAAEVDDDELARIRRDELAGLAVIGAVQNCRVVAFAAFDPLDDPVPIEYIAVDEHEQGRGLGTALVAAVREAAGGRAVCAETDDDAVDFYRRLGFAVSGRKAADPRWPGRRRYDCLLA